MLKVMLKKSKSMQNNLDVTYSTVLYNILCSYLHKQYCLCKCFHKCLSNITTILRTHVRGGIVIIEFTLPSCNLNQITFTKYISLIITIN
jgi:hypothetical protein